MRSVSRAAKNGPWVTWWGEMARKTVLRRLMKRLPSSADIDAVLENDNETNDLTQVETPRVTESPVSRLRAAIGVEETPTNAEPVDEQQPQTGEQK